MKVKSFLSKKKGVTLLEGVIAIALLALVASGTFGVLLSVSRKSDQPDRREDMIYAIDSLNDLLKSAAFYMQDDASIIPDYLANALCFGSGHTDAKKPLKVGVSHDVKCLLPPSCDRSQSSFSYEVTRPNVNLSLGLDSDPKANLMDKNVVSDYNPHTSSNSIHSFRIKYDITCNGYSL